MSQGRSLKLFLVDGSPTGLLTAEIMNWTGHVLTGPRSKLTELLKRREVERTGVYFLIGPGSGDRMYPQVYIGETDNPSMRLRQHNKPEESGGKDFWETVCLVTSKDSNLTKAHVKYLECQLMKMAKSSGCCDLVNGTDHDFTNLPESDIADMGYFLDQIRVVLPVLGMTFLREKASTVLQTVDHGAKTAKSSPLFVTEVSRHGIKAQAREIDGEFVVLEGSSARSSWDNAPGSYKFLYEQLVSDGVLGEPVNGVRLFKEDYIFSSPSAAAAVVCGRSTNGRIAWRVEDTGQTYANWQEQQIVVSESQVGGGSPGQIYGQYD